MNQSPEPATLAEIVRLVETAGEELEGPRQLEWLERLDAGQEAIEATFEGALAASDGAAALRIAAALHHYWILRGRFSEGAAWLQRALDCGASAEDLLRARAVNVAALMAWELGDASTAGTRAREGLALGQRLGDRRVVIRALRTLEHLAFDASDLPAAEAYCRQVLALSEAAGEPAEIAGALHQLGVITAQGGNRDAARGHYERSLEVTRAHGDRFGLAKTTINLAHLDWLRGDADRALRGYGEALRLCRELGHTHMPPFLGVAAGMILAHQDRPGAAARIFGLAEALREETGIPLYEGDRDEYEHCVRRVAEALGAGMAPQWELGRRMSVEQAAAELLSFA